MASSCVLRAGMMDHLRPAHKDGRQAGMAWCWRRAACPSILLWQIQCFVSLFFIFLASGSDRQYRGNTDAWTTCTWLWMLGRVKVNSWGKCFLLDHKKKKRKKHYSCCCIPNSLLSKPWQSLVIIMWAFVWKLLRILYCIYAIGILLVGGVGGVNIQSRLQTTTKPSFTLQAMIPNSKLIPSYLLYLFIFLIASLHILSIVTHIWIIIWNIDHA